MNSWTLPSELNQPLPRHVKMHGLVKLMIVVLNIFILGLALYIILSPYKDARKMAALKSQGVAVEGDVVSFHSAMLGASHPSMAYYVDYHFRAVADRATSTSDYQSTSSINFENYKSLQIGQKVPIIFNPIDPNQSALNLDDRVHTGSPYGFMRTMFGIALVACGIPYLLVMTMLLGLYYRDKRLVMWGLVAQAKIINEQEVRTGKALSTTTAFYEFTDGKGKTVSGSRGSLPSKGYLKQESSRKYIDAIIANPTVLYNPRNSSRNMLYPSGYGAVCYLKGPKN